MIIKNKTANSCITSHEHLEGLWLCCCSRVRWEDRTQTGREAPTHNAVKSKNNQLAGFTRTGKKMDLLTLWPSKWAISMSKPTRDSTSEIVTFVYKSSPLLSNIGCLKNRTEHTNCELLSLRRVVIFFCFLLRESFKQMGSFLKLLIFKEQGSLPVILSQLCWAG